MQEKERQDRLAFEKEIKEKELQMKQNELEAKMALEQANLDKHGSSSFFRKNLIPLRILSWYQSFRKLK